MLKFGDSAPTFSLKGVDGQTHSLDELKGEKGTAVIFSCNHCPYVKAYEDRMIQLAKEYQPKGIAFVLINANDPVKYPEDSFENMQKRAREKGYPFPYLWDETQEVAHAYEAERTPEVFLFDAELKLRYHGAIDDNWEDPARVTKQYLKDALEALLAGREPEVKETQPVGCTIKWK
jgi:peroxiredoxin